MAQFQLPALPLDAHSRSKIVDLPVELDRHILQYVLLDPKQRNALPILLVSQSFYYIALHILHSELHFTSVEQLEKFAHCSGNLVVHPQVFKLTLAGGNVDYRLFPALFRAFQRCIEKSPVAEFDGRSEGKGDYFRPRLHLRRVELCLNSHVNDPFYSFVSIALASADPEEFVWTGPDPGHHFSIAIVPNAMRELLKVIPTWTNLRFLKLTNLAFPTGDSPLLTEEGLFQEAKIPHQLDEREYAKRTDSLALSILSSPSCACLREIYLGQVTDLDPKEIAIIATSRLLPALEQIRLVDAYLGSIWGSRVRIDDVQRSLGDMSSDKVLGYTEEDDLRLRSERLSSILKCEGKTERIIGGDRMDTAA